MRSFLRTAFVAALLALVPAGQALAACGVGSTIWEGRDSIVSKVLAFTTNVWTFKGISTTFEISGCDEKDNLFKRASTDARIRHYASANLDHLAADMARGSGEHLDAFAHVIQLEEEDLAAFRTLTQNHFEACFPHDRTTSGEMLDVLSQLMREHQTLSVYVRS